MAKPSKKHIVTGSDCANWTNKAIGFVSSATTDLNPSNSFRLGLDLLNNYYIQGEMAAQFVLPDNYMSYLHYQRNLEFVKYNHNNRVCGLILNDNDDGSFKIALLGSDCVKCATSDNSDNISVTALVYQVQTLRTPLQNDKYAFPTIITYGTGDARADIAQINYNTHTVNNLSISEASDVKLNFTRESVKLSNLSTFFLTGKYKNNNVYTLNSKNFDLSSDKNNTLVLGCPISDIIPDIGFNTHCQMIDTYNTIFTDWEGDWFTRLEDIYSVMLMQSLTRPASVISEGNHWNIYTRADVDADPKISGYERSTHAFQFTPFNLILTRSESEALQYLNTGAIPSDAFLYPMDWENMPNTADEHDSGDSGTSEPTDETGESGIHGTPTQDATPQVTTNMLNNNNLYWLQAGQLESFITWFWQNAGEIIDTADLWNNIKGLYNNLAEAVINIRYFPVDVQYIGGTVDTSNITISSVAMPMENVKSLTKTKLKKRTLGSIDISRKYNAFTDMSPYTTMSLYLPFHGWLNLDTDIFMTYEKVPNKLEVRCVYDHMSGTIQYGIYVISGSKEYIVNSIVAKMAVDIPITLQSKHERDSAIFTNVAGAVGSLMGAGASIASANPVGLVMSTASIGAGGAHSAPIHTMGTVGENGAFFTPNKCAIYIKRPSYNRPTNYNSRVGFPSNTGGVLSKYSGFTTVYNPHITFTGNVNNDGVTMKPLESEIDEIYNLLEKGVIL